MKCKVIRINNSELLEDIVNDWLKTGNYEIFNFLQVVKGDYLVTTIFYYTEKELRKKKLNNLKNHDTSD